MYTSKPNILNLHLPRKRFGQHFLVDKHVITKIINSGNFQKKDLVLEIGPGRGALTKELVDKIDNLYAIEFDRDLVKYLQAQFVNLRLYEQDALKFDYSQVINDFLNTKKIKVNSENINNSKIKLIGNLPYNIATPLLFRFVEYLEHFAEIIIMVQKEVAMRITAKVGDSDYGRLAVSCKYYFRVEKIIDVSAGAFNPPPKVRSSVLRLIPQKPNPELICDPQKLTKLVKTAFSMRRKTLTNNLKPYFSADEINKLGDSWEIKNMANLRPQDLPAEIYFRLAQLI